MGGPIIAGNPANPRTGPHRPAWSGPGDGRPLSLLTDPARVAKAAAYLTQELAKLGDRPRDACPAAPCPEHAQATTFEQANALHRLRQRLSDAALAYLGATFVNLDRATIAGEVLDVLATRVKSEPTEPGHRRRSFWAGQSRLPFNRGPVEAALAALAFASRPQAPVIAEATDWPPAHARDRLAAPEGRAGPGRLAAFTAGA